MKKIKIIKILSEYKVIINAGSIDGIEKDDRFNIVDPKPRVLEDPDTNKILDTFPGYKSYIVAEDVKDGYSICRSPIEYRGGIASVVSNSISSLSLMNYEAEKIKKPLNISEYDIDDILNKYTDSIIVIGDEVVKES